MSLVLDMSPEGRWRAAIARWMQHDDSMVLKLLGGDDPIPPEARQWLRELAAGRIKRPRGRPKRYEPVAKTAPAEYEKFLLREEFARELAFARRERDPRGGTPTERALSAVASAHAMSTDQVSHIVFRRTSKATK